jgi:aspartate beta-hydroxylase
MFTNSWLHIQKPINQQQTNHDDNDKIKNPAIKELYEKAKSLDAAAEREKSNKKLLEAIEGYKELILTHGDKVNDTIFKEIAGKCIERMRFLGKLKQVIDIHYKLIHRFVEEPSYRNQLAVTYLLGNR